MLLKTYGDDGRKYNISWKVYRHYANLKEWKSSSQHVSRNQYLLRYGCCPCNLSGWCSVRFTCISPQLSALRHMEMHTLSFLGSLKSPHWHSLLIASVSRSHWSALNKWVFWCLHGQKSKGLRLGDHVGQLTGPLDPIHYLPKVWFRYCLIVWIN
jgi:hypothetical protein